MRDLREAAVRRILLPAIYRRSGISPGDYLAELSAFDALDPQQKERHQWRRLLDLLRLARERSPYYKQRLAHLEMGTYGHSEPELLSEIPILTKSELRLHGPTDFMTRSPGRTPSVETAGTSGEPVKVYFDWNTYSRTLLRRDYCYRKLGIALGQREARFWGRSPARLRGSLRSLLSNRRLFSFQTGKVDEMSREASALAHFQPAYIYGYSSLVLKAADFHLATGLQDVRPKAVICTAETLLPSQAARIARAFASEVTMEYGCSELDIIAFGCPAGNYHVLEHHVLVEAVSCENGSDPEAVITDLDNTLMPLIRYRLGDHIHLSDGPCPCGQAGKLIESIEGRTLNRLIHYPDGRTIHAVVLAHAFEELCHRQLPIGRFKVFQTAPDRLEIMIEMAGDAERSVVTEAVRQVLTAKLGGDFALTVVFEKIPDRPGEKFTYFVPLTRHP
jgi:phenylacetate-CoA ligase